MSSRAPPEPTLTDAWLLEDALLASHREVSAYGDTLFAKWGGGGGDPSDVGASKRALKAPLYAARHLEALEESIEIDVTSFLGYRRFQTLLARYDSLGLYPMPMQLKIRDQVFKRLGAHMYREDWANYRDVIERFHRSAGIEMAYFAVAPRRQGKTTAMAAIMASLIATLPRFKILVASVGMRASLVLRGEFMDCLRALMGPTWREHLLIDNQEHVEFSISKGVSPDRSKIVFLPASSTGGRGQDADLLVVDEFAFVSPSFWKGTLIPIASADATVVVGITTPPTQPGFMMTLLGSKDSRGVPLFPVEHFRTVCDPCSKKGLLECPCVQDITAPWRIDPTRKDLTRRLYGGDQNAQERELAGRMVNDQPPVFDPDLITQLARAPRVPLSPEVTQVLFFIDPSGGGTGSRTAVLWGWFQSGTLVVRVYLSRARVRSFSLAHPHPLRYHPSLPRPLPRPLEQRRHRVARLGPRTLAPHHGRRLHLLTLPRRHARNNLPQASWVRERHQVRPHAPPHPLLAPLENALLPLHLHLSRPQMHQAPVQHHLEAARVLPKRLLPKFPRAPPIPVHQPPQAPLKGRRIRCGDFPPKRAPTHSHPLPTPTPFTPTLRYPTDWRRRLRGHERRFQGARDAVHL